jgi:hypothetical protein
MTSVATPKARTAPSIPKEQKIHDLFIPNRPLHARGTAALLAVWIAAALIVWAAGVR